MAVLTNATAPNSIFAGMSRVFDGVVNFLISISESHTRVRQIEALSAKSDAQLADMGLRREDIVGFVFRDKINL